MRIGGSVLNNSKRVRPTAKRPHPHILKLVLNLKVDLGFIS